MPFPIHRLRRLRRTEALRSLVRETRLDPAQFILPLFVCPGEDVRREIGAMPGNYQMSIDQLVGECAEVQSLGIGGVILFGLPESKDDMATGAYDENGIVQRAIRAIRKETPYHPDFADGLRYMQVIQGVYDSAERGCVIPHWSERPGAYFQ